MDSNVIIAYLGNRFSDKIAGFLGQLPICISVITRIEIVGWYNVTNQQVQKLIAFTNSATVLALSEDVILQTISIRQKNKIKLPDAIIAATAVVNKLTLITSNTSDFKNVADLDCLHPTAL